MQSVECGQYSSLKKRRSRALELNAVAGWRAGSRVARMAFRDFVVLRS
jgi:hypothetical protein